MASEHSALELAFFARALRELWKPNSLPLLRGGTRDRPFFPGRLAPVSRADRARLLGFRFPAPGWNLHRPRAFHYSRRSDDRGNNRRPGRELSCARPDVDGRKMGGTLNLRVFGAPWLRASVDRARSRQEGFRKKENPAACAHAVYL